MYCIFFEDDTVCDDLMNDLLVLEEVIFVFQHPNYLTVIRLFLDGDKSVTLFLAQLCMSKLALFAPVAEIEC